jgi:hypothetical protein
MFTGVFVVLSFGGTGKDELLVKKGIDTFH